MAVYIDRGDGEEIAIVQGYEWLMNVIQSEEAESFKKKFEELYPEYEKSGDTSAIFSLFLEYSEELFASISDNPAGGRAESTRYQEVESFFALVMSCFSYFHELDTMIAGVDSLCELLGKHADQQPELRLRLLMQLYNTFTDTMPPRFRIFKNVVSYAAKANLFDQVLPYLKYLDAWMEDWKNEDFKVGDRMCASDERSLFLDLSKYMRDLGKRVDAFLYLKRYAQLFQGAADSEMKDEAVEKATIQLLQDALQLPAVFQFDDLLAYSTVKALSKGKHKQLIELCELFLSGDVKDLDGFHKKNAAVFKEYDINFQEAMSKMRLLTLATKVHGKSEISLSEVAVAIEESEDNVERWVVRALSEGVIDGRIDQLNHKVLVKSSFQREFGKAEWAFLDSKLTQWTENLEQVIKFIGEQKKLKESIVNSTA
jgi:translation initiation factor 3 subunit M